MSTPLPHEPGDGTFRFIDEEQSNQTADEFLKTRVTMMREHFSYERLSGCSLKEINSQIEYFNRLYKDTHRQFGSDEDIVSLWEYALDSELDLYEPMSHEQKLQLKKVFHEVGMNFDKAAEEARDRNANRLSTLVSAIPGLRRLTAQ
jgi:hypothetical protein